MRKPRRVWTKVIRSDRKMQDTIAYMSRIPPGYEFEPKDDELILHYLRPKIVGKPLPPNLIHEANISEHNPDYFAENFRATGKKPYWYFFTSRDRKYPNGRRPNRTAGDGYWKATGADKIIVHAGERVGCQKALVYFKGKYPKGEKTSWLMHEFKNTGFPSAKCLPHVNSKKRKSDNEDIDMRLDDYVLCRIYNKEGGTSENELQGQELEVKDDVQEAETYDERFEREADISSIDSVEPSDINTTVVPETMSSNDNANIDGNTMNCGTAVVGNVFADFEQEDTFTYMENYNTYFNHHEYMPTFSAVNTGGGTSFIDNGYEDHHWNTESRDDSDLSVIVPQNVLSPPPTDKTPVSSVHKDCSCVECEFGKLITEDDLPDWL